MADREKPGRDGIGLDWRERASPNSRMPPLPVNQADSGHTGIMNRHLRTCRMDIAKSRTAQHIIVHIVVNFSLGGVWIAFLYQK